MRMRNILFRVLYCMEAVTICNCYTQFYIIYERTKWVSFVYIEIGAKEAE